MTESEAKAMLAILSEHYRCPVMPIDRYCNAFRTWADLVQENGYGGDELAAAIHYVRRSVEKSNLLARMLYDGEEPRTEKCPIHHGHWSGCVGPEEECPHCMSGSNVTGWVRKST